MLSALVRRVTLMAVRSGKHNLCAHPAVSTCHEMRFSGALRFELPSQCMQSIVMTTQACRVDLWLDVHAWTSHWAARAYVSDRPLTPCALHQHATADSLGVGIRNHLVVNTWHALHAVCLRHVCHE